MDDNSVLPGVGLYRHQQRARIRLWIAAAYDAIYLIDESLRCRHRGAEVSEMASPPPTLQKIEQMLFKVMIYCAYSGGIGVLLGVLIWIFGDTGHISSAGIAIAIALFFAVVGFVVGLVHGLLAQFLMPGISKQ